MARFWDLNARIATGPEFFFRLKAVLKAAGWTVPMSSDGTTYSATPVTDQIVHAGAGAQGMDNARAWFRIRDPGGGREFTFQRGITTNHIQWRIKYSRAADFIGGAPAATVTPTATDEAVVQGSVVGTDSGAIVFNTMFTTTFPQIAHFMADNVAPYPFYGFNYASKENVQHVMALDPAVSGTAESDVDPVCIWSRGNDAIGVFYVSKLASATTPGPTLHPAQAWTAPGKPTQGFVFQRCYIIKAGVPSSPNATVVSNSQVHVETAKDMAYPILLGRDLNIPDPTPNGIKQFSSLFSWSGTPRPKSAVNITGPKSHAVFDDIVLPWNG